MMEPQPDYIHPSLLLCQQLKTCGILQGGLLSNSEACLVLQTDANSSPAETVTFAGSPIALAYFKQDHEHVILPHSNSPTEQQHGSVSLSGVIFTLFNLKCINSQLLRWYLLSIIFTELGPNWIEQICMGTLILAIFVTHYVSKQ